MRTRELKRLLAEAAKLTSLQKQALMNALRATDDAAQVVQALEARELACPHCHSERIVRNGHASGLQRYKCRDCARTFNTLTATPLARLRHKEKWERQADVLRQGLSVHQAAGALAVAPSTAFRWRHRFLQLPQNLKAQALQGVIEADETYFLRSHKGQRVGARKARHRGGSAAKRGLSEEQEPVLVARDRSGATADFILERSDKAHTAEAPGPGADHGRGAVHRWRRRAGGCSPAAGRRAPRTEHLQGPACAGRLAHPERQCVPRAAQDLDAVLQRRGQFIPGQLPRLVPRAGPVGPNPRQTRTVPHDGRRRMTPPRSNAQRA